MIDEEARRETIAAFAADVEQRSRRVKKLLSRLRHATGDREEERLLAQLTREAHNLRGAAGTLGLEDVEALATGLETLIQRIRRGEEHPDREVLASIARALASVAPFLLEELEVPRGQPDRALRTVLYFEDNESNLVLVERALARRPHVRLLAARTAGVGFELARTERPDLILLDLDLPDLRGDEVLRVLRGDPDTQAIPVVIVSAEGAPDEIERMLAEGAVEYLLKPIEIRRLLELVDSIWDRNPSPSHP